MAALIETAQHLFVAGNTSALVNRRFVPFEAELLQGRQNEVGGPCHHPGPVQVLDPHQPFALVPTGQAVAADSRYQGAEMQRASGTGGKTPNGLQAFFRVHDHITTHQD